MKLKRVAHYLVYLMVRLFICVVQAVPITTCQSIARALAFLANDIVGIRRKVVENNLSFAFPDSTPAERKKIARQMWEHLLLMVCEIAHAPRKLHETNWRDYVHLGDRAEMVRYLLDRRSLVIISGHYGNFEMGGYMLGLWGFPTFTIARTIDNPFLDDFVNRFRGMTGQFMLNRDGSANEAAKVLERGDTVAFLGDQAAGPKGVWVEFFGRRASCPKGIALFSLASKTPMLVSYFRRTTGPMHFETGSAGLYDPAVAEQASELGGVKELTQWYNHRLEELIRVAPEQYWWLHRRWKDVKKDIYGEQKPAAAAPVKEPNAATADSEPAKRIAG